MYKENKSIKPKATGATAVHNKFKFVKNNEKVILPWETSEEFYDLHAKKILSNKSFYHVSMIGNPMRSLWNISSKKPGYSKMQKFWALDAAAVILYIVPLFVKTVF
jgi:hypothetical protein